MVNRDNGLYVGITSDPPNRLYQHGSPAFCCPNGSSELVPEAFLAATGVEVQKTKGEILCDPGR